MKIVKPSFFNICKMGQYDLKDYTFEYLKAMKYKPIKENGFVYAKGSIPVLLVAHLDTVHRDLPKNIKYVDGKASDPNGIGGDDRCGVYMILKIIRELKCSVLFTEDEEIGCVGALKFCKSDFIDKLDVNYIVELDRKGKDDAVFYDCDNPEFTKFCTDKEFGFKKDYGSFTDISYICKKSGIAGVNFSCGYYRAHTLQEYVDIPTMEANIGRVKGLILKKVDEPFEYIEKKYSYSYGGYYGGYYGGWYSDYYGDCYEDRDSVNTRIFPETAGVTMSFSYFDSKRKDCRTDTATGKTKAECYFNFFRNHPNVCFNDIYDWDTF